jgi:hypothetical protein
LNAIFALVSSPIEMKIRINACARGHVHTQECFAVKYANFQLTTTAQRCR